MAVICLERFCQKHGLVHPAITQFIDQIWKVTQVDPDTFSDWERGFSLMPITGQGDPYPADLIQAIPEHLAKEFDQFTQFVFETSATTWYGSDIEGTKKYLLKVLKIASKHGIPIPDLTYYKNPPIEQRGHWGAKLTDEQLQRWRDSA